MGLVTCRLMVSVLPSAESDHRSFIVTSAPLNCALPSIVNSSPSHLAVLLIWLSRMVLVVSLPSVEYFISAVNSPIWPLWVKESLRSGSSWVILSVRESGAGIAPKSLLPAFNFQFPVKLGFAWACASPKAAAKSATENTRIVLLRMILLLLLEYHLHLEVGAIRGYVPLHGHGLAAFGQRPTVLCGEFVAVERSLGIGHQVVAFPFERGFEFVVAQTIDALLAIGGINHVGGHVASAPGLGEIEFQAGILMHDLFDQAIGRGRRAEIALGDVRLPGSAEVGLRLRPRRPKSQGQKRQRKNPACGFAHRKWSYCFSKTSFISASPMGLVRCRVTVRVFPSSDSVQRSLKVISFPPKVPLLSTASALPSQFSVLLNSFSPTLFTHSLPSVV